MPCVLLGGWDCSEVVLLVFVTMIVLLYVVEIVIVLLLRSWDDCFIAFRVIGWINLLLLGFLMDNSLFSVVLVTFRLLVSCSHFYLALIVS